MNFTKFEYMLLPYEFSEEELKKRPEIKFPNASDVLYMFVWAVGILGVRMIFENVIAKPLSLRCGIVDSQRTKPASIKKLEELYKISKHPTDELVKEYAENVKLSEKGVQYWLRRRRNIDRPFLSKKFAEALWRATFYIFAFVYGICTLWKTPWFWDNKQCWQGYPFQNVWPSIYYYYMIEGGFYISLLFSIFKDVKRKDFVEQLIHHLATIFLIVFSYSVNFVRVGSMVMAIHDVSDILLEFGKSFFYAGFSKSGDNLFTIFAIVFIVSRLVVFPCVVLHTTLVKSLYFLKPFPGYYFFNVLLLILQVLHIFWAAIILKMAYRLIIVGKIEKDARSDVEELSSDDIQKKEN